MADPIGELDVLIGGDYSDLQDAISQAQDIATQGASDIADAFDKPDMAAGMTASIQALVDASGLAGGALTIFQSVLESDTQAGVDLTQSLTDLAGSASTVGSAVADAAQALLDQQQATLGASDAATQLAESSGTASQSISEVGSSASTAGNEAEEASAGFGSMVEQMAAIAGALVITKGLEDFGEEALTAAATIQSVTVGLTALTGSAQQADQIIGEIKSLAETEPFAFPEIAPTVQKMVAMGIAASAIPGVLQAISDTAAATTNSFQAVASMFDRMTISGTANTRSLATLGISFQGLGAAMSSFGVTANATSKEVTAAFKALPDQATRVQVLEDALSKFAGTATAEAQTIGGQWQIFQNNFEEVMVAVGNDLAPVVSDILAFGKAVLSGVQTAAGAFKSLPVPVQDVIVALGLLTGAAVPVTAGLAALGLGISGLSKLIPLVTDLFGGLGAAEGAEAGVATESVAAHTAAATAIEAEGVAAEATATEVGAAGVATGEAATAFGLAGTAATVLEGGLIALGAAIVAVDFKNVASDVGELGTTLKGLAAPGTAAGDVMWTFEAAANSATGSSDALKGATAGLSTVLGENLRGALMGVIPFLDQEDAAVRLLNLSLPALGDYISEITGKWAALPAPLQANLTNLEAINAKLSMVGTGFEALAPSVQKVIDEVNKQNTAVAGAQQAYNALHAALQSNKTLSDGTVVTQQMVAAAFLNLESATKKATDAIKTHTTATGAMKDSYANVQKEAASLVSTFDAASATLLKVTAAQDGSAQSLAALAIAQKNYDSASKALYGDLNQVLTAEQRVAAATDAIYAKQNAANAALKTAQQVYHDIAVATQNGATNQGAFNDAVDALVKAYQAANPLLDGAKQSINDIATAAINAANQETGLATAHTGMITMIKNGQTTVVQAGTDFKNMGTQAGNSIGPIGNLGSAHAGTASKIAGGHGTMTQAATDIQNLGFRTTDADTPIANLGTAHGKLIEIVGAGQSTLNDDGVSIGKLGTNAQGGIQPLTDLKTRMDAITTVPSSTLQTFAQAESDTGKNAYDAQTPLNDLGIKVDSIGVIIHDANGEFVSYAQSIQNLGTQADTTGTYFDKSGNFLINWATYAGNAGNQADQFDTSLIKVLKGTTDADTATQNYGQTIINADGTITNLTDLLKSLATQWESVASATNDATQAQQNYNSAASSAPSGSGKSGNNKSSGYVEGTPPDTLQAIENYLAFSPPSSATLGTYFNAGPGVIGNPQTGQMGAGAGPTTYAQQNAGSTVLFGPGLTSEAVQAGGASAGAPSSPVSVLDSDVKASLVTLTSAVGNSAEQMKAGSAIAEASMSQFLSGITSETAQQGIDQTYAPGGTNYGGPAQTAGSLNPIYMTDASGNLLVSTDGGATWSLSGGSSTGVSSPITGLDPLTTSLTNLTSAATTASTAVNTVVDQAGTAGLAPTTGNVWNGSQSNPATGEPGTPMYTVTGSGTAASPFQWVPTGQVYAGTTNTAGLTQTGAQTPLTGAESASLSGLGISQQALDSMSQAAGLNPQDYLDEITNEPLFSNVYQSTEGMTAPTGLGGAGTPSTFYGGGQNLSSGELAAISAMGMTPSQFSAMAAAAGMSPSDYLDELQGIGTAKPAGYINETSGTEGITNTPFGAQSTNPQGLTTAQIVAQQNAMLANPIGTGMMSENQASDQLTQLEQISSLMSQQLAAITNPTASQTASLTTLNNEITTLKGYLSQVAPGTSGPLISPSSYVPSTLTSAQLQALLNNPGVGNGAVPPQVNISLTINNPQLSTTAQVNTAGTQLVNALRGMASQIKFV